ncbi:MAG: S-layer homology domain-containing protein [Clostridia bacterium]|nr:S-layer homology domain-containing protein [Clostridia bacterium]
MKKIVAIVLVLLMLVPTAYADTTASGELEKVLVSVKSKIEIPTELNIFESHISEYREQVYYNFDWHSPDYEKSVSISADEEGHIRDYYVYTQKRTEKKLSGISKKEIISFAEEFLKKALPEMYADPTDVLVFDEKSYSAGSFLRYSLTYKRYKNDIFVKDNFVNVTVGITEDDALYISNMSSNIDYKTPFAERDEEITDYVQKYKEAFPGEMVYRNEYNPEWKEKGKMKYSGALIYRIKDGNAGFISLETGEIVTEDENDDIIYRGESAGAMTDSVNKNESALTPEELKEISAVEGLLSVAEIEAKVKKLPYIKFPKDIVLKSSNLSKNDEGKYIYSLGYSNEKEASYGYLHMSVYAEDGKLISFNMNDSKDRKEIETITDYQKTLAKENAEKFLTAVAETEFSETNFEKSEDRDGFVSLYYPRIIEGVKHISEGIRVAYDTENGTVTNYSLNFTQTGFPSPHYAIRYDEAYTRLLEYSPIIKMYVKSGGKYVLCATLEKKGVILDGLTGDVKDAYKEQNQSFSYDDISGHWVEEAATKLSEVQLGFDGGKLKPDQKITQEELLRFIASGIYGKYYHTYETEDLYENLIREKVISEEEKNPSANITREDAFVFIIRMAGLEKVAKLENIYKVNYADSHLLSEGKIGYCAILSGLGVVCGDGGCLRPQDNTTYAETVIMLYRYLLTL